jgi:type I restriction enzyme S subunit
MNAELLLAHFNRISDSSEAVPRLRRFILDLAVRGKLVKPDPSDEPSSALAERIAEGTRRRKKAGEYDEPRNAIEIESELLPFKVPSQWCWERLVEIAEVSYGFAFESARFNQGKVGMPLIRIRDISNVDTEAYYEGSFDPTYIVHRGDYLVGMDGDFNVREWKGVDALLNQRVTRIRTWRYDLVAKFLTIPLQRILDHLHIATSQTTVKHLSAKQLNGVYLPIPPIPEQHRIVAKVDELMALCDRLEATQRERESRRDQFAASTHHRLNNGADAEDLRSHAQFLIGHLPRLTARPDQIKQLRQTILNLAVRGKLIPQNHYDEPVAELLDQIHQEQDRLIKKGAIPKRKVTKQDGTRSVHGEFPPNWANVEFSSLCNIITSGSRGWAEYYADKGPRFIRAQNIRFGRLRLDDLACVNPPDSSEGTRTKVSKGDLLIVITGAGVTNPALLEVDLDEAYVSQHVALIKPTNTDHSSWLLLFLMAEDGGRAELVERAYGAGKPGLNLDNIRSLATPVPPLAEQRRIVARVDELMAICDQLESRLTTAQTESARLLESVLHHALKIPA